MRLIAHGRLYTKDRLANWGMIEDQTCPLCNAAPETISHLFFQCSTSAAIWNKILRWQGIGRQARPWEEELQRAILHQNGKSTSAEVYRMSLAGCLYYVWQERNYRSFRQEERPTRIIVKLIIQDIFVRGDLHPKIARKLLVFKFNTG